MAKTEPSTPRRGRPKAKLWQAVDKLRNNMDAAEYKHVVLRLIVLSGELSVRSAERFVEAST